MKSTGYVRKLDQLGRISLPMKLRCKIDVKENPELEFFIKNEMIILKKYNPLSPCLVTNEFNEQNKELTGGIILSQQGAEELLLELQSKIKVEMK